MKRTIKLTAGLLLLFLAGCDTGIGRTGISSERTLTGIQITKLPALLDYFIDEPLDLDGIEVTAVYSDDTREKVFIGVKNVSGFDSSTPGTKILTVTWNDQTDAFPITVDNVTLVSIEITSKPAKTGYSMYEELDLDGLEVTVTLSDKTTRKINIHELDITGFDPKRAGEQTVTVGLDGKSDTFTVTVTAKTFTITFEKSGGDSEADPTVKTITQPIENIGALPSQPTKAGYLFTGWNTKADGSGSNFIATTLVTDSFTVYAQWFKPVVTFYSNGGSEVEDQDIDYGSIATEPPVPIKTGYNRKFAGWYTDDENFTDEWIFTNTVIANVELYAKWIPYELGDTGPGGGKIFYSIEAGFTIKGATANETAYYLEASPKDFDTTYVWGNGTGTGTAIGDGKKNTQIIVEANPGTATAAAKVCDNYTNNGFNDWFLPSKEELYQLFVNRVTAGVTLETSSSGRYYWSSSAVDTSTATAYQYYNTNITDAYRNKANTAYVRAVRAF